MKTAYTSHFQTFSGKLEKEKTVSKNRLVWLRDCAPVLIKTSVGELLLSLIESADFLNKLISERPNDDCLKIISKYFSEQEYDLSPVFISFNFNIIELKRLIRLRDYLEFCIDNPEILFFSDTYINIFDTDMTYSEDGASAVQMKVDFIMTFCEVVKGSQLTAKERSVIDRCTKIVYMDYVTSNGDKNKLPNLTQFYDALKKQDEKEAADIALSLESYVTGSFNIFAHDTNIEYNKRFIIFDIFEMGNQLQTVGLMVLLEILWQRVIQNKLRGIRTWVWTDEFSIMFNDDSSGIFRTGEFFEKIYKRIRKHGGVATGATQNISEVIKSKQAMTMLQNSEFLVLLAQKEDDLDIIKKMLRLSDNQAKYLDIDEAGKGLIKCGKRIIPFSNLLPTDSLMYKICSTKFKDLQMQIRQGDSN